MKYKSIALLGATFGMSLLGFGIFSLIPVGYLFYIAVLKDEPLPRSEHQYLILGLLVIAVLEFILFNWLWAIMFAVFLFTYVNKNSTLVKNLRILKKEGVEQTKKVKKKVKEFEIDWF